MVFISQQKLNSSLLILHLRLALKSYIYDFNFTPSLPDRIDVEPQTFGQLIHQVQLPYQLYVWLLYLIHVCILDHMQLLVCFLSLKNFRLETFGVIHLMTSNDLTFQFKTRTTIIVLLGSFPLIYEHHIRRLSLLTLTGSNHPNKDDLYPWLSRVYSIYYLYITNVDTQSVPRIVEIAGIRRPGN